MDNIPSTPKTVTAYHRQGDELIPVTFDVAELTRQWYDRSIKIADIASQHHTTVFAVRKAATLAGLPDKSQVSQFAPKSGNVDVELLTNLLDSQGMNFDKAAAILGISRHTLTQTVIKFNIQSVTRNKVLRRRECIRRNGKRCKDYCNCKRFERAGLLLACESELDGIDVPISMLDTDTAPSHNSGSGLPYCSLAA